MMPRRPLMEVMDELADHVAGSEESREVALFVLGWAHGVALRAGWTRFDLERVWHGTDAASRCARCNVPAYNHTPLGSACPEFIPREDGG